LYHYAGNNPVRFTDPTGRNDVYAFYNATSEALKIETELLVDDASTPEPSDTAIPKWAIYAVVIIGTALVVGISYEIYKAQQEGSQQTLPPGYSYSLSGNIIRSNGTIVPTLPDAWDEYNGDDYYKSNPKHNQNARGNASKEPENADKMFYRSIRDPRKGHEHTRWYKDKKGVFHRFMGSNNEYHWNGSTDTGTRVEDVPSEIRKALEKGEY
jgi:hypothetical protein